MQQTAQACTEKNADLQREGLASVEYWRTYWSHTPTGKRQVICLGTDMPVVAATFGALHPETLRLLHDFARLETDAAERHAVANPLRSPLTPEQLCQRRGATFARLRMQAQLYSLRASATRLTGKHWAAPYASSLLPRSQARARCGVGGFAPAPAAHVLASR
jgi:hypothetical protein